jgi:radical SAM/Cys-rich protein
MNTFVNLLEKHAVKYEDVLRRKRMTILQVNMGNLCNQKCMHCHIDASPQGKDIMSKNVVDDILKFLTGHKIKTLDITGGAPELNPHFDYLVSSARPLIDETIVRTNLTVIFEPQKDYLPEFFKRNTIHLVCSLPCYTKENVELQRGRGVFEKSIRALRILNGLGYAKSDNLHLDLAHNPTGPNLPAHQNRLEKEYKRILSNEYGIYFNRLITITNVPVKRFKDYLESNSVYRNYVRLLEDNFNVEVLENLMCRTFLSVGFDGRLYDCDFNLALGLTLENEEGRVITIDTLDPDKLDGNKIFIGEHCLVCTAGSGSSCQGALSLRKSEQVRDDVKYFYKNAAIQPRKELCCPVSYEQEELSYIPKEVMEVSYGCGSPISLAKPNDGEVVVDLGCGAGIDCFIAARKVGITGKVIGIDMTGEMLEKANKGLEKVVLNLGFLNCEFRQGYLEDIPVETESVDLVTSNCVVNLSSDKSRVFKEVYRILKDGGRFVIADIVSDREVPVYMQNDRKLWGECIAGALMQSEFLFKAKQAGFHGLRILKNFKYKEVEGIQFCSITVEGYKVRKGKDCTYIGQYATYLGPYSEVRDDNEHIFPRGIPVEICTDTAKKLIKLPYAGQFIITNVEKDGGPNPCCSSEDRTKPCC